MPSKALPIVATTKVAELLDHYPELEDVLIGIAPPFKKLKNPFLRKSVAKVASLRHIAVVGGVPLGDLINTLRSTVGQEQNSTIEESDSDNYFAEKPDWYDAKKVVASIIESEENADRMALIEVHKKAKTLNENEILELITSFLPAPGIDIMRQNGFHTWSTKTDESTIKTYFLKAPTVAS